jgi:hypothetical protein
MDFLIKMILKQVLQWMQAHPDAPFTRFMRATRGPRQDVRSMTRIERLRSALSFLLWGLVFFAASLLLAYSTFALKLFSQDNVIVLVLSFGLVIFAGIGLIGGLYLLVRVIF